MQVAEALRWWVEIKSTPGVSRRGQRHDGQPTVVVTTRELGLGSTLPIIKTRVAHKYISSKIESKNVPML